MVITKETYNAIVELCPLVPPESGGILGGHEGIVDTYGFDKIDSNCLSNSYRPNVLFLNDVIHHWADIGIEFCGIFHSHSPSETSLSLPDRGYICRIMENIPNSIKRMNFPLVFPRVACRVG